MSKEWIVPPRPKPGRKPAVRDASNPVPNRSSAQKAVRERKKEQLDEMAERIRQLEKEEGEKCVFFQQQAQKAKEETASLRAQNDYLQRTVDDLRRELNKHQGCSGSQTGSSRGPAVALPQTTGTKRRRTSTAASKASTQQAFIPNPAIIVSQGATLQPPELVTNGEPCCGLCSSDTSCFCTDVGFKIDHSLPRPPPSTSSPLLSFPDSSDFASFPSSSAEAIVLPLRTRKSSNKVPIWSIQPMDSPTAQTSTAMCSGDPSSCPACQNDPFGQAFCRSLSESVCSVNPCSNCPSKRSTKATTTRSSLVPSQASPADTSEIEMMDDIALRSALADLPCCGAPELCGSLCRPGDKPGFEDVSLLPKSVQPGVKSQETLPCNEAWTALKCHPNIAFANLQMLADVVARRTNCDGPSLESSLPAASSPPLHLGTTQVVDRDSRAPGKRKRLTVERGAVADALLYLDSQSPH